MADSKSTFDDLVAIMARLRSKDGCPWDREQTLESLRPYLIEEAYEVLEAMESGPPAQHCEELGDLLLQIVFQAQLASEQGKFSAADVTDSICRKLLRRHPHVFGQEQARTAADVVVHWERIKQDEKQVTSTSPASVLDGVPLKLPALLAAQKLSERAARLGFDWQCADDVLEKVNEELNELQDARQESAGSEREKHLAWEIGDLLFALVNLARHLDLSAEDALRAANKRFRRRFKSLEQEASQRDLDLKKTSPQDLEALWLQAKRATDGV